MKSTFRILFYLKKNQLKKNGNAVIMVRITVDGEQTQFSSKLDIDPDTWDVSSGRVIGRSAQSNQLNRLLDDIRANINMHYNRLMSCDGYVQPQKIRNIFLGVEEKADTLVSLFTQHNEQYKLKVGMTSTHKTYSRYELTKQRVIDFIQKRFKRNDIAIKEITTVFIEDFYLYIRNNTECSHNSTIKFVQRLKTVLIYARNSGITFLDPFANYKLSFERTDRGYLDQSEIDLIYNKEFISERLSHVRDVFIFSCYTGLSYVDVCKLTRDDIKMGFDGNIWIMTKRHKTNVDSNIRLLDVPKSILIKYENSLPNGKLLATVSNQKSNEYLKEIASICGINKKITFHLARHSFATTICLSNGVPIETVSKMLGHTNIKTTQIYARITDMKMSNDMEILAQKINAKQQTAV